MLVQTLVPCSDSPRNIPYTLTTVAGRVNFCLETQASSFLLRFPGRTVPEQLVFEHECCGIEEIVHFHVASCSPADSMLSRIHKSSQQE